MVRIAVTGGIACGKSRMGLYLRHCGVEVCDTDELAHDILRDDALVHRKIVELLGRNILDSSGLIDRAKLGDVVFRDRAILAELNAIIHPVVKQRVRNWLDGCENSGVAWAVVLVPLLFEAGMRDGWEWDAVVCVSCSLEVQLERLERRGLSRDDALRRINAQMALPEKERMSDFVIRNDGSIELFEEKIDELLKKVGEKPA